MNKNSGYYYDASDSIVADNLLNLNTLNHSNSSICDASSIYNGYNASTASTHIYEGNYIAFSNNTINLNQLPNIYQVFF